MRRHPSGSWDRRPQALPQRPETPAFAGVTVCAYYASALARAAKLLRNFCSLGGITARQ